MSAVAPCYLVIVELSGNIALETTLLRGWKKIPMKNKPTVPVRVQHFVVFDSF